MANKDNLRFVIILTDVSGMHKLALEHPMTHTAVIHPDMLDTPYYADQLKDRLRRVLRSATSGE